MLYGVLNQSNSFAPKELSIIILLHKRDWYILYRFISLRNANILHPCKQAGMIMFLRIGPIGKISRLRQAYFILQTDTISIR